ncbi:MAG: S-layer homology domain-containing protein [Oscillospiraceae bacterium]|jgi:hypothetical protein|nr:S-layer homology domain-containing protein [Oscillospiraceae bacterium]
MKKFTALTLLIAIALSLAPSAFAANVKTLDSAVNDAAAYILNTVAKPEVGSVGGEWAVIGLARSSYSVPASYFENYYKTAEKYVKDKKGLLHDKKYTEYSRVILGLTAAGFDPRNVGGYDLTAPLEDFDKTIWQGINGPIWALIALDSGNYASSRRENFIAEILSKQLPDGGWNLSGISPSDPDMTGMALQALAKYQDKKDVKTAVEKALKIKFTYKTSEGIVQMLVASAALGKSTDALVDELLKYRKADGSFSHILDSNDGNNQMATEQALYGLVAAQRARDGKSSLYEMGDINNREQITNNKDEAAIGLPGKHIGIKIVPVTLPGKTFSDIKNHASKTAIEALAEREIISGANGLFNPNNNITIAGFAAIVTKSLGLYSDSANVVSAGFSDVSVNHMFAKYINTAAIYKLVSGSGGKFNPDATISRESAAALVANAAKICGLDISKNAAEIRDTLAQFGDYTKSADWARGALAFCYSEGILDEKDLDIRPKDAVTRAEIAEMLYRLLIKAELMK